MEALKVLGIEGEYTQVTSNVRHFRFIAGLRLEPAPYRLHQLDHDPQG